MDKIHLLIVDSKPIVSFDNLAEAKKMKHLVEQVFYYLEHRTHSFMVKHPFSNELRVKDKLYKAIKKNQKFNYLNNIYLSKDFTRPELNINSIKVYNSVYKYNEVSNG